MVIFTKHLEQVCRTNLFHFEIVAVNEFDVFRALNNSNLGALFCVVLIYHKEALVKFWAQLGESF